MPLRRRTRSAIAAAALLVSGNLVRADHFVATWNTDGVGNWTDASRWDTDPLYPNNGTDTFDAIINSGDAEVTLNNDITINTLDMTAGLLTGTGTKKLTLESDSFWTGGDIVGVSEIRVKSTLEIGLNFREFATSTIEIEADATLDWWGGQINATDENGGGGIINNAGTIIDETDSSWTWGNVLSPILNNTGSYLKTAGSVGSQKSVWAVFNNDGFVDVQAGDLWLSGGGAHTGSIAVSAHARLLISDYNQIFSGAGSPTTTFSSAASINSLGTVIFSNDFGSGTTEFAGTYVSANTIINTDDPGQEGNDGRVTFVAGSTVNFETTPGTLTVESGTVRFETGQVTILEEFEIPGITFTNVTFSGGTVDTTDDLYFSTLDWSAGTLKGNGLLRSVSSGSIAFTGTGPKSLEGVTLFNGVSGLATISEGSLTMRDSELRNLGNATIDLQGDPVFSNPDINTYVAQVRNFGTILKSAGTGSAQFNDVNMINNGTIIVQSGTLRLNGGGDYTGHIELDPTTTLELGLGGNSQTHFFQSGSTMSGAADSEVHVFGNVEFLAGSSTNVDRFKVEYPAGNVKYEGGELVVGDLTLNGGAQMYLTPGGDKTLKMRSITVEQFSESSLDLADNKAVVDYGESEPTPLNHIRNLIAAGHNGGGWDGEAIVTSEGNSINFGLGYAENSILNLDSFGGYAVDDSSILIKYTWYGDANLDGIVNVLDMYNLASSWQSTGTWFNGDFNYDGFVDASDLGLVGLNWLSGMDGPLGEMFPEVFGGTNSVPEPRILGACAALLYSFKRPRRRR